MNAAVCEAAGQTCSDVNPSREGMFLCSCPRSELGRKLGGPAACVPEPAQEAYRECEECPTKMDAYEKGSRYVGDIIQSVGLIDKNACQDQCVWYADCTYVTQLGPATEDEGNCRDGDFCCIIHGAGATKTTAEPSLFSSAKVAIGENCAVVPPSTDNVCAPDQTCYDPSNGSYRINDWMCLCPAPAYGSGLTERATCFNGDAGSVDECTACDDRVPDTPTDPSTRFDGTTLAEILFRTVDECRSACAMTTACKGYTHVAEASSFYSRVWPGCNARGSPRPACCVLFEVGFTSVPDPGAMSGRAQSNSPCAVTGASNVCTNEGQVCSDSDPTIPGTWQCACLPPDFGTPQALGTAACGPTPYPPSPVPPTPQPPTAAPPTSAPPTRPPPTSEPPTPSPPTPLPPTPSPPTLAPPTPLPRTPLPATAAPPTLRPPTPSPPASTSVPTSSPVTPPPPTAPPKTQLPSTSTPSTSAPGTRPFPTLVPPTPPPTILPRQTTEDIATVQETAGMVAFAATLGSGGAPALQLAVAASTCEPGRGHEERYTFVMAPLQLQVFESKALGSLLGNIIVAVGVWVVGYVVASLVQFFGDLLCVSRVQDLDAFGVTKFPSIPLLVFQLLYPGTTFASLDLLLNPPDWRMCVLGAAGMAYCLAVPAVVWRVVTGNVPKRGTLRLDPTTVGRVPLFLLGRGEWVSRCRNPHWAQRWSSALRPFDQDKVWFFGVDLAGTLAISGFQATIPDNWVGCGHIRLFSAIIFAVSLGLEAKLRPHLHARNNILDALLLAVEALAMLCFAGGYYTRGGGAGAFAIGAALLMVCVVMIVLRMALDLLCVVWVLVVGRRRRLQNAQFETGIHSLRDLSVWVSEKDTDKTSLHPPQLLGPQLSHGTESTYSADDALAGSGMMAVEREASSPAERQESAPPLVDKLGTGTFDKNSGCPGEENDDYDAPSMISPFSPSARSPSAADSHVDDSIAADLALSVVSPMAAKRRPAQGSQSPEASRAMSSTRRPRRANRILLSPTDAQRSMLFPKEESTSLRSLTGYPFHQLRLDDDMDNAEGSDAPPPLSVIDANTSIPAMRRISRVRPPR